MTDAEKIAELLAALEELALEYDALVDTGSMPSSHPASKVLQAARAAIARVKGDTP